MGLAASQARLLTITARLADNELRSQTINNAKMRLSTQSSQASENYINALNRATLEFTNYDLAGESQSQSLTFNALTAYSSYNNQYGLVNAAGQLLVSEDEAVLFEKSGYNLNSYLALHGLEYDTTFFEQIGDIDNVERGKNYPVPFDYITVEEMETYYSEYNSYENSLEVERFENGYNRVSDLLNGIDRKAETFVNTYLLEAYGPTSSSPKISQNGKDWEFASSIIDKSKTPSENAANFIREINALNNTWKSLELVKTGSTLDNYINTITTERIKSDGSLIDYGYTYSQENGIYTLDNGVTYAPATGTITLPQPYDPAEYEIKIPTSATSINDLISNMEDNEYEKNTGNLIKTYKYTPDPTEPNAYSSKITFANTTEGKEAFANVLNSFLTEIIKQVSSTENLDNIYNFATNHGASLIASYPKLKASLEDYTKAYSDYTAEETAFLSRIFKNNVNDVLADLNNGYYEYIDENGQLIQENIELKDFKNFDTILTYMSRKNYEQADEFNTVIKEFMIDELIEEYGTPKYAWVDRTDVNNEGNADAKAQWYTNLFNRMSQGYKALENGLASSKEWIEYALESGIVTMEQVDNNFNWQRLDYKACSRIIETTNDADVTKAEAEYTRAMNDIEAKDSIYDMQLKNIDTEHSSLQTEYESIKGVISKNVERTFNFYKNA